LFWYWNSGLDALHAELVGISFSYEKGKDFTYPFRRIRLKQKHSLKNLCQNEKIEKMDRIWNMI
jgi:DNA polymerase-1